MRRAWRCARSTASTSTEEGVVLHDKDLCIGCGYCFYACPFGAPQFPQAGAFGLRGKMDKCTFCAGGPEKDNSAEEFRKYGANRLAQGKLPACAEMCSTKALLGGDGDVIADIYRQRVLKRGKGSEVWGWGTAYGKPGQQKPRGRAAEELSHDAAHAGRGRRCASSHSGSPGAASSRRSWCSTSRASTRASPTPRRGTAPTSAASRRDWERAITGTHAEPERVRPHRQ